VLPKPKKKGDVAIFNNMDAFGGHLLLEKQGAGTLPVALYTT
jgi:hypothetical protein